MEISTLNAAHYYDHGLMTVLSIAHVPPTTHTPHPRPHTQTDTHRQTHTDTHRHTHTPTHTDTHTHTHTHTHTPLSLSHSLSLSHQLTNFLTTVSSHWHLDLSHGKFGLLSSEKASCDSVAQHNLWYMLAVFVFK